MAPVQKKFRLDESNESISASNDESSSGFIRLEVDNASDLTPSGVFSPVLEVYRMPWKLLVKRSRNSFLEVYLYHRKSESDMWSVNVAAEFSLINVGGGENNNSKIMKMFNHEITNWGRGEFCAWEDVVNEEKGFVKDNKIIIEVRFTLSNAIGIRTIPRIDYSDPNEPSHDVAFVIDGEKIYVNKGILSVHSPVFRAMFYGDFAEKNENEIELKDVDRKNLIGMLNLIYPSHEKLNDSNVEPILNLSDRFQISVVIDQAEQFLINSTKVNDVKKLNLSDRYRLVMLQDHSLSKLKTVKDVSNLRKTDGFKELSDKAKALLLEKVLNLSDVV